MIRGDRTYPRHLIVYAKRPLPGQAKTRLGACIGPEEAAGVYARLLYGYLLDIIAHHQGISDRDALVGRLELSVASPDDVGFFSLAFPEFLVRPQIKGDLGQRMAHSFNQA